MLCFTTFFSLTWWLVMVEQWPYRASLLIQLKEDYKQKEEIQKLKKLSKQEESHYDAVCQDDMKLIDIFKEKKALLSLTENYKSLCSLDYDPEIFELFLEERPYFTFGLLEDFLEFTINLDFSLKETLALSLEQARMKETAKKCQLPKNTGCLYCQ